MAPISSLHIASGVQDARSALHVSAFEHINKLSQSKLTSFAQSRIDLGLRKFVLINNLFDHLVSHLDHVDQDTEKYEGCYEWSQEQADDDYDEVMVDQTGDEQSWLDACLGELDDSDMEDASYDDEHYIDMSGSDEQMSYTDEVECLPTTVDILERAVAVYDWARDEILLHLPHSAATRALFLPPIDPTIDGVPVADPPKRSVSTPPRIAKQLVSHIPKSAAALLSNTKRFAMDDPSWVSSHALTLASLQRSIEWEGSSWMV
ncbi:hypothetical protein BC937DRAFT_89932 [Endogone sp. FLAS-F59071]|nr:hypothetical protein BC937DRAFT_89932 [Endogone sp. FLAS-F59071]|eukprot:RUS17474.1 hypothetical protein BC937DRAFT_89932 [Endogone sp. FLAS-F59071]